MKKTIIILTTIFLALGCCRHPKAIDTLEAILSMMRADTSWIRELDSLAQMAIGPGAKCIDPVWHTFSYDGRTWFFNQDWGGVLEIPADYIPEDDSWQAEISFHGTRAWSPDSLILVSYYAGLQALTIEEFSDAILGLMKEDGFAVQEWGENAKELTIQARSGEGINYYGRYIFANDDGVEFFVSVQYPDEKGTDALKVIEMADRYPAGPNGIVFKGEAL